MAIDAVNEMLDLARDVVNENVDLARDVVNEKLDLARDVVDEKLHLARDVVNENLDLARDVANEKLDLARDVVNEIKLERVHIIGPLSQNPNYDRKILYKFSIFADRELVRKRNKSTYYIHEQFPPEIVAKRRRLVPRRSARLLGSPPTHCT